MSLSICELCKEYNIHLQDMMSGNFFIETSLPDAGYIVFIEDSNGNVVSNTAIVTAGIMSITGFETINPPDFVQLDRDIIIQPIQFSHLQKLILTVTTDGIETNSIPIPMPDGLDYECILIKIVNVYDF